MVWRFLKLSTAAALVLGSLATANPVGESAYAASARACNVPLTATVTTATRTYLFGQTDTYLKWSISGTGTCTFDAQNETVAQVSGSGSSPLCTQGEPAHGFVVAYGQTTDLTLEITETVSTAAGRVTETQQTVWFSPNVAVSNPVPYGRGDGELSGYVFPVATPFEVAGNANQGAGVLFANIFGECPVSGRPFSGRAVYSEAAPA